MENVKTKLLKLLALKNRGVGGEALNAAAALDRLLAANGLTLADLEEVHAVEKFTFNPRTEWEKKLLTQIIFKVMPADWPGVVWTQKGKRGQTFEMTPAQHAEASVLYDLYKKDLKKVQERAFSAFIQSNRIFKDTPADPAAPAPERTPAELAEIEKVLAMAAGIDKTAVHKQIR